MKVKPRASAHEVRKHLAMNAHLLIVGDVKTAMNIERIMTEIGKARKDFYKSFGNIEEMVDLSLCMWFDSIVEHVDVEEVKARLESISPAYWALICDAISNNPMLRGKFNRATSALREAGINKQVFSKWLSKVTIY